MVEIITKRDGPRREDVKAKSLIRENWGTIEKLADQISGGSYSASKVAKPEPQPDGLMIHIPTGPNVESAPEPHLRISPNGRVIIMDIQTRAQLHFIGQITHQDGQSLFVLATRENGFVAPLEPDFIEALRDLENTVIDGKFSEDDLACELNRRLNLE